MKSSDVKYIVVHCSDSPQGRGDGAEAIHRWHLEKGWSGIGYHYVINENGGIEHGRPTYWEGAHAYGYNSQSIGICLIGRGEYTEEQYNTLAGLLKRELRQFTNAVVVGHKDLNKGKECPMFDVIEWWKEL